MEEAEGMQGGDVDEEGHLGVVVAPWNLPFDAAAVAAAQGTAEQHQVTAAAVGAAPHRGGAARPPCGTTTRRSPQYGTVEVTAATT